MRTFRTIAISFVALVAVAGANAQPRAQAVRSEPEEPRPIAPRGPLAPDEQQTIGIFQRASPSVVYITTVQHVRNPFSRNVMRVPQGTGSGFVWDERGERDCDSPKGAHRDVYARLAAVEPIIYLRP